MDDFFDIGGLTSSHASEHINLWYFMYMLGDLIILRIWL